MHTLCVYIIKLVCSVFCLKDTAAEWLIVSQAASGTRHLVLLVRKPWCRAGGGSLYRLHPANSPQVSQSLPDPLHGLRTSPGMNDKGSVDVRVPGHTQIL